MLAKLTGVVLIFTLMNSLAASESNPMAEARQIIDTVLQERIAELQPSMHERVMRFGSSMSTGMSRSRSAKKQLYLSPASAKSPSASLWRSC